jgi:predicted transcriptional regulator
MNLQATFKKLNEELTQAEIAEITGVAQSTVCFILNKPNYDIKYRSYRQIVAKLKANNLEHFAVYYDEDEQKAS